MTQNEYELDDEAKKLFEQLDGLEDWEKYYFDEQKQLNDWRKCIVEFAYILASNLNNYRLSDTIIKNKDDIRPLMERLNVMSEIPSRGAKKITIRHRGLGSARDLIEGQDATRFDYVVSCGDCVVDKPFIDYLVKSKIMELPELNKKLDKAFRFFSRFGIYIIEMVFNDWELKDKQITDASLLLWARYFTNFTNDPAKVIRNEANKPDPNLTILAGLNRLKITQFQGIVNKVSKKVSQDKSNLKFVDTNSTFDALFLIDELKTKLVKPSIEINNNNYIQMWRHCFDKNGRFSRAQFNRYRSAFAKWKNAFYFIWLDLKSVELKEDRTTIINCIVKFIKDSDHVNAFVDFILKDFFYYPLHLHYSDMNALIFVNMLLFKNFGDRDYDFGRTPEDLLISEEEKNIPLVERLSDLITNEWESRFYEKVKTIEKNLYLALEPQKDEAATLSADVLINLMREVFIFLTLVRGGWVHKLLRNTVEEYGDPQAAVYKSKRSGSHMKSLLQFFQIAIRCMIMFNDATDIDILNKVKGREKQFLSLKGLLHSDLSLHKQVVNKIMQVADRGVTVLKSPSTRSS